MEPLKVLKIGTITVKTIFSLLSFGVCAYGVLLFFELKYITEYRKYERVQLDYTVYWPELVTWLYIGLGAAITIINCCCIAVTRTRALLIASCITLTISVLLLVSLAVVTLVMGQTKTEDYLRTNMINVFTEMGTSVKATQRFHDIEESYHCCGVNKATDYKDILKYDLKGECCNNLKDQKACITTANSRYGCLEVVSSTYHIRYVGGTVLCSVTAVLGLLNLILNSILLKVRNKDTVKTNYISATKTTEQYVKTRDSAKESMRQEEVFSSC